MAATILDEDMAKDTKILLANNDGYVRYIDDTVDGVLLTDTPHPSSCASSVTISRASRELGAQHAAERRQSPPQQEPRARARSRPASRASTADRYKQVLPVPYACASAATSSDGVSWCILKAWEDRAAAVLENLIAVRISTAPKHRWQPVSEIRSEI